MEIQFVASIAMIAEDPARSRKLYVEDLGLPLAGAEGSGYVHSEEVEGTKHFGVWPLGEAAQACFDEDRWPEDRPVPQVSVEFEVASADAVGPAAEELAAAGHELLHPAQEQPWGQTVARLISPEGAIVGISYTPPMH